MEHNRSQKTIQSFLLTFPMFCCENLDQIVGKREYQRNPTREKNGKNKKNLDQTCFTWPLKVLSIRLKDLSCHTNVSKATLCQVVKTWYKMQGKQGIVKVKLASLGLSSFVLLFRSHVLFFQSLVFHFQSIFLVTKSHSLVLDLLSLALAFVGLYLAIKIKMSCIGSWSQYCLGLFKDFSWPFKVMSCPEWSLSYYWSLKPFLCLSFLGH